MLDNCSAFWAHPVLVPVILLEMLMFSLESGISKNITAILDLEDKVQRLPSLDIDIKPMMQREDVTKLLTDLHNTLKTAIKLLDAANWMEKAAAMLHEVGIELNELEEISNNSPWIASQWVEIQGF
jgi:hypothetical protein